jgi:multicomponent Na+:H+ antiporter subunit F
VTQATFAILAAAAAAFVFRLLAGPTLADRVSALNGLLIVGMGAIATNAAHSGNGAFLPVLVAVALVGPISNGMIARFIERQAEDRAGRRDAADDDAPEAAGPSDGDEVPG